MFRSSVLPLGSGAYCDMVYTDRFHFSLLSLTFSLGKLSKSERAALLILCRLFSRGCRRYDSPVKADVALGMLYDAVPSFHMRSSGDEVFLRASIDFANDMFGESVFESAIGYLSEVLRDPILRSPLFSEQLRITLEGYRGDLARESCEPEAMAARRYSELCAVYLSRKDFLSRADLLSIPDTIDAEATFSIYKKLEGAPLVYVSSVGALDEKALLSALDLHFPKRASLPTRPEIKVSEPISARETVGGAMTRIHLGYRITGDGNACSLLATLLGGHASSRLFTVLREEEQLCYSVSASFDRAAGMMTVSAALSPDGLDRALELTARELEAAKNLSESDFSQAKDALLLGALEIPESRGLMSSYLFSARLRAEVPDVERAISRVSAITKEDVEAVASTLTPAVVYIGSPSEAAHGTGGVL